MGKDKWGFAAGNLLHTVGTRPDMRTFFESIREVMTHGFDSSEHEIIDRLYRRYVTMGDQPRLYACLDKIERAFSNILSSSLNWQELGCDAADTDLDFGKENISLVFEKYFEALRRCMRSQESLFQDHGKDMPLVTLLANPLGYMEFRTRKSILYDQLEGLPFWLR